MKIFSRLIYRRRGGGASPRTDLFLALIRDTGYDLVVFLDVDDSDTVKKLGQRMSDIVPLGPVGADGTNGPVATQVKLLDYRVDVGQYDMMLLPLDSRFNFNDPDMRHSDDEVAPYDADGWGDLAAPVRVVGEGRPFVAAPSGEKPERKAIVELGIANAKAQPNAVVGDDGVVSLIIDGVRHQISRNGLKHGLDRRLAENMDATARIGEILNAAVAVPVAGGERSYRMAAIDTGSIRYVLITEKNGVLDSVYVLQSVNTKSGRSPSGPSVTSQTAETPPDGISVANLKEVWEGVFMPGLRKHQGQKQGGANYSDDSGVDGRYRDAVERGDLETVRRMVDARAKRLGGDEVVVDGQRYFRFRDYHGNLSGSAAKGLDDVLRHGFPDTLPEGAGLVYHGSPNNRLAEDAVLLPPDVTGVETRDARPKGTFTDKVFATRHLHEALNYATKSGTLYLVSMRNPEAYARRRDIGLEPLVVGDSAEIVADVPASFFSGKNKRGASKRAEAARLQLALSGGDFSRDVGSRLAPTSRISIKLADPVTYDDAGKVIPLSERFDFANPDVRWSVDDAGGTPWTETAEGREMVRAAFHVLMKNMPMLLISPAEVATGYVDSPRNANQRLGKGNRSSRREGETDSPGGFVAEVLFRMNQIGREGVPSLLWVREMCGSNEHFREVLAACYVMGKGIHDLGNKLRFGPKERAALRGGAGLTDEQVAAVEQEALRVTERGTRQVAFRAYAEGCRFADDVVRALRAKAAGEVRAARELARGKGKEATAARRELEATRERLATERARSARLRWAVAETDLVRSEPHHDPSRL